MVGAGFCKVLSHEHLVVGHTHEDIGDLAVKLMLQKSLLHAALLKGSDV